MIQNIKIKKCILLAIILIIILYIVKNISQNIKIKEGMIDESKLTEMELDFKRELQSDPTEVINRMTELDLSYDKKTINFTDFFDILQ